MFSGVQLVKIVTFVVEYCCFIREAFPRFDFIEYGQQTLTYVLTKVTINAPHVQVKHLQAKQLKYTRDSQTLPDSYSCLCQRSLRVMTASHLHVVVLIALQLLFSHHASSRLKM